MNEQPTHAGNIILNHIRRCGAQALDELLNFTVDGAPIDVQDELQKLETLGHVFLFNGIPAITRMGVLYIINNAVRIGQHRAPLQGNFEVLTRDPVVNDLITEHTPKGLTPEDCAVLWSLGIRVDDDMRGAL